jgi:hypothetical protein
MTDMDRNVRPSSPAGLAGGDPSAGVGPGVDVGGTVGEGDGELGDPAALHAERRSAAASVRKVLITAA